MKNNKIRNYFGLILGKSKIESEYNSGKKLIKESGGISDRNGVDLDSAWIDESEKIFICKP